MPGSLRRRRVRIDVTNPACGDMLRLTALVEQGAVLEARFLTRGCTASIAASSALTEWLAGRPGRKLSH